MSATSGRTSLESYVAALSGQGEASWVEEGKKAFAGKKGEEMRRETLEGVLFGGHTGGTAFEDQVRWSQGSLFS